jgi:hypothetical protein
MTAFLYFVNQLVLKTIRHFGNTKLTKSDVLGPNLNCQTENENLQAIPKHITAVKTATAIVI